MKILKESVKQVLKQPRKWREAASSIILAKNCENNYKVLLFNRHEKSSVMPSTSVFPGGVFETHDESPLWSKYFKSLGLHEEQLTNLILKRDYNMKPFPDIFTGQTGDCLHRDISLRITAIRETFEEMGILLCRDTECLAGNSTGFGSFREDFDRELWQHLVHNDASQFLNLCQELRVIPDLWSMKEWSVWLTPSDRKKRFQAAFYLVSLESQPHIILEENEGIDFMWLSPKEALLANNNDDIILGPPQIWELSRLCNFDQINEIQNFAKERASKGTLLMQPSRVKCLDGIVSLLPGDSEYPCDPNATTQLRPIEMTQEQYRACAKKLHRYEFERPNYGIAHMNFEPVDGHLKPLNLNNL